jgi:hypothetical protein
MPNTVFDTQFIIGTIRFGHGEIWGHFDTMWGVGLLNERCKFHGKQPFGPALVSISIRQSLTSISNMPSLKKI